VHLVHHYSITITIKTLLTNAASKQVLVHGCEPIPACGLRPFVSTSTHKHEANDTNSWVVTMGWKSFKEFPYVAFVFPFR